MQNLAVSPYHPTYVWFGHPPDYSILLSSLTIQRANIKFAGYLCPRNSTRITIISTYISCFIYFFLFHHQRSRPVVFPISTPLFASQVAQWERIQCQCRRQVLDPWLAMIPWRRKWQPTPAFLPGKFHGQSLARLQSRGSK